MRYSKFVAWAFAAVVTVLTASAPAKAQDGYWDRGDRHREYREERESRDLNRDYARVDRLREDIAEDQWKRNRDYWSGRPWAAAREERDIARDRRELRKQIRDIQRDRADMYQDRRHRDYDDYWRDR